MKRGKKAILIILACVVGMILLVGAVLGIKAAIVMAKLGEDAPKTVERPTAIAGETPLPSPSADAELVPLDNEPDADSFELDIDAEDNEGEYAQVPIYRVDQKDADVLNILILGQDYDKIHDYSSRTDVILLLSYNRALGTLKLLSIQRDTYVPIEGFRWNRVNTCYHFGGVGLAINTINEQFGLDVQNYVTLAFSEFETLVDAIGGIELPMENGTTRHHDGHEALGYVRNRSFGEGEWGRARRQRAFMVALYHKVRSEMSMQTLLSLVEYAQDYIRTNLSLTQMFSIAKDVYTAGEFKISSARIPFEGTWHYAKKGESSVIAVDIEENARLAHEFLYEGGKGLDENYD